MRLLSPSANECPCWPGFPVALAEAAVQPGSAEVVP